MPSSSSTAIPTVSVDARIDTEGPGGAGIDVVDTSDARIDTVDTSDAGIDVVDTMRCQNLIQPKKGAFIQKTKHKEEIEL